MQQITLYSSLIVCLLITQFSPVLTNEIKHIDGVLTKLHQTRNFNGVVLIAEQGEIKYERYFGYADHPSKTPFTTNSMSHIASVSKTFTAVAAMMLIEKKQLKLTDELQQYLPELPYPGVTIKHLLTHTSGLYGEQKPLIREAINGKGYNNQQILAVFTDIKPPLNFIPGSNYNYSNTNYTMLALIIEQVSGISFPDFLQQNIFKPAGMQNSFLGYQRVPTSKRKHIMSYYRKPTWLNNAFIDIKTLAVNQLEKQTYSNKYGASQIHTTARDLFKYHQALQSGKLLKPAIMDVMYQPIALNNDKDYTVSGRSNYPAKAALGWRLADDRSAGRIAFHSGGFRGGRSLLIRNLDKDQVIIILTNNTETDHHSFTFPMRALNQQDYQLDLISLPRLFANLYLENGIESAVASYRKHHADPKYKAFIDWDFEEIGHEMLARKDSNAAIQLAKLYTQQLPDDLYAWMLLGQAYREAKEDKQALQAYQQALALNPEVQEVKLALKQLEQNLLE